jgi:hypothetical protein
MPEATVTIRATMDRMRAAMTFPLNRLAVPGGAPYAGIPGGMVATAAIGLGATGAAGFSGGNGGYATVFVNPSWRHGRLQH